MDYLARVEGEGALDLHIENGEVTAANLRIFEPPRFFEAFLRGRSYTELPDIVARICGICPIAYQLGAIQAVEDAFEVTVDPQVSALRRLIYCGEWIQSHALHVVMLHAPDFLGYPDAIQMAEQHREAVRRGLALKQAGNALMCLLGGREIHPVSLRAGGFHRVPTKRELEVLCDEMKQARDLAKELVIWVSSFPFPAFERDYEFVALRHDQDYPITAGRIVSSEGIDIAIGDYEHEFEERQVPHSTALQSSVKRRGAYLVGPMARYAINHDRLPQSVQELADSAGIGPICRNPFQSIVIRALEILHACDEAVRLIAAYEEPSRPFAPVEPRAAVGFGCTEAPRGICWHRYEFAEDGTIRNARIVPPTSQNQSSVEADLKAVAALLVDKADNAIRTRCEMTIRNYDPCISCAAHFLKLTVHRP
ncbi:nickel-dependent hydrogenase large subunit [Pontixanthobacter gangjinensis]